MYTLLRTSLPRTVAQDGTAPPARRGLPRVSRTVFALGCTSLFTDISSEMVSSVLPLYVLVSLRLSIASFGVIDGLYQGVAAIVALLGGVTADRWRRHKAVAATGYGVSTVARAGLLAAGGAWPVLTGVLVLDRIGKGVRTAPRDALIALSSRPGALGLAFGVHRALDTLGAFLGPILAFVILSHTASDFDAVFLVSCCAAIIGLAVLLLFVADRPRAPSQATRPHVTQTAQETPRQLGSPRAVPALMATPRFGLLLAVSGALSVATISDSFIYLVLQRGLHVSLGVFPLLYVGTSLAYLLLAVPAGWLADRLGTGRVFVGGYALLLVVYTALIKAPFGTGMVLGYLTLLGAFYAATDGVLRAHASVLLPASVRTTGLALLTTVTSGAGLIGSVLFGMLWTWRGYHVAVACFCGALSVAVGTALLTLVRFSAAAPRLEHEE